eukprot:1139502-Pelagomonas_calceolata.AAC.8
MEKVLHGYAIGSDPMENASSWHLRPAEHQASRSHGSGACKGADYLKYCNAGVQCQCLGGQIAAF